MEYTIPRHKQIGITSPLNECISQTGSVKNTPQKSQKRLDKSPKNKKFPKLIKKRMKIIYGKTNLVVELLVICVGHTQCKDSNISNNNIYSDIRLYQFFVYTFIRIYFCIVLLIQIYPVIIKIIFNSMPNSPNFSCEVTFL